MRGVRRSPAEGRVIVVVGDAIDVYSVAPEYPVMWPFGEQSKRLHAPRRVHETRIDALYHVARRGSTDGVLVLVEYKMHMELPSRAVWRRGVRGGLPPTAVRSQRLLADTDAARCMLNAVAVRQTYQNRQAETNAWLVYVNTGILPTHCLVVHSTRRQAARGREPGVRAVPGHIAGEVLPVSRTVTGQPPTPVCVVAARRLDMRQEFMR